MRKIPSAEELAPYFHALGKFIQRYAEVEATVGAVLWIASGTNAARSRALFSGTRVRAAADTVKRLHEADGKPLSPWLERAFDKLGEITTARDRLLHYGIQRDGEALLNTDRDRALSSRAFESRVTVDDLHDLEADTIVVHACLNMYWIEERRSKVREAMRAREEQLARSPWRYKPPQPANASDSSRRAARK